MSTITAAEYCAGYGGLALAVEQAFGATTVQVSEIDPAACMRRRWRTGTWMPTWRTRRT